MKYKIQDKYLRYIISMLFLGIFVIFIVNSASAQSFEKTIYQTHDNRWIEENELIKGTDNYPYLIEETGNNWKYTINDKSIFIPKQFDIIESPIKISPCLTYSKSVLINNMVNYNSTVAYLVFPYSLSQVKDYSDNNNIKLGRWLFKSGSPHISIYDKNNNYLESESYIFKIVNDEIRLYFIKSDANNLNGDITFQMNSWSIEDVTQQVEDIYYIVDGINGTLENINVNITYPYSEPSTDGLVGYWELDDNYLDSSGNNNNGTAYGGNISFVHGKINNGTQFGGIDDYISIPDNDDLDIGLGAFSISVFVNTSAGFDSYPAIIDKSTNGDWTSELSSCVGYWWGYYPAEHLTFKLNNQSYTTCDNLDFGIIHDIGITHLVVTIDGVDTENPQIIGYINGEYYNSVNRTKLGAINTDTYLYIGEWRYISRSIYGMIDNVRIYNKILNQSEIDNIYYNSPSNLLINTSDNPIQTTWINNLDNPLLIELLDSENVTELHFDMSDIITIDENIIYDAKNTTIFNVSYFTSTKIFIEYTIEDVYNEIINLKNDISDLNDMINHLRLYILMIAILSAGVIIGRKR